MWDIGYRYRENVLDMKDSWVPGHSSTKAKFYDITFYNADVLSTSMEYNLLA